MSPFPGYTRSAVSGGRVAETFPELCQLRFSCIWRQTPEKAERTQAALSSASASSCDLRRKVKHHHFQPTPRESQVSADKNHHADASLRSLSVYLTPVDFDPHQKTANSSVLARIAVRAHKGRKHRSGERSIPVYDAAVDLPLQGPLVSLLGHSASVAPF